MPGGRRLLLKEEACRRKQGAGCHAVKAGTDWHGQLCKQVPAPESTQATAFSGNAARITTCPFFRLFFFPLLGLSGNAGMAKYSLYGRSVVS